MSVGYILNLGPYPNSTSITTAINAAIVANSIIKIASATGVDGAVLATTALTWQAGIGYDTHDPIFYIVKRNSGTLGISVIKLKNSVGDLSANTALLLLTAGRQITINNNAAAAHPNTGDISVEVTTAGLGASTFDIFAYGIARP